MEKVQQHEWVDTNGKGWLFKCPHCKWIKINNNPSDLPPLYTIRVGASTHEEPPCITRYPEQEAGKDE